MNGNYGEMWPMTLPDVFLSVDSFKQMERNCM